MNRAVLTGITVILALLGTTAAGQNLVQNPGFEAPEGWDRHWKLSSNDPSSPSAMAQEITSDTREGIRSVQLSNSVKLKWTYLYSDSLDAPIVLRADKKYEVKGWVKVLEMGKEIDLSIFWNGSKSSQLIFGENPDPADQPDWFAVCDTIYPDVHCSDAYLRLGFRSDKDGLFPTGRLLLDDFSVTRIPEVTDTDITAFEVPGQKGETVIDYVTGTVSLMVEAGTALTGMVPEVLEVSEGATVDPSPDLQADFSSVARYKVTAADGITSQLWEVHVEVLPATATEILEFTLPGQSGATAIDPEASRVVITMPFGTGLASLVPRVTISEGAYTNLPEGEPVDFSVPVEVVVTAEDGISQQVWTIEVGQEAPSTAAEITGFEITGQSGETLFEADLKRIVLVVPYGTDVTALVPVIEVSEGATVVPVPGEPTDFTEAVTYTVTAQDGSTVGEWTVLVEVSASYEAEITGFVIGGEVAPATIDPDNNTILVEVSQGTDLTAVTPEITVSPGASVIPASGETVDLSSEVVFTVTAGDGTVQKWVVAVETEPAVTGIPGNSMDSFRIYPNPANEYVIIELSGQAELLIQDLHGKAVASMTAAEGTATIQTSHLERGIYLVTVRSAAGRKVTKLVLE